MATAEVETAEGVVEILAAVRVALRAANVAATKADMRVVKVARVAGAVRAAREARVARAEVVVVSVAAEDDHRGDEVAAAEEVAGTAAAWGGHRGGEVATVAVATAEGMVKVATGKVEQSPARECATPTRASRAWARTSDRVPRRLPCPGFGPPS